MLRAAERSDFGLTRFRLGSSVKGFAPVACSTRHGSAFSPNLRHLQIACPMIFPPIPIRTTNSSIESLGSASYLDTLVKDPDLSYD